MGQEQLRFMIGTYAQKGGPGVMTAVLDQADASLRVSPANTEMENPSWLTMHPSGCVMYAAEETEPVGYVTELQKTSDGWHVSGRMPTESAPCHLSMDDRHEFLFVSNYMAGSLGVFRLDKNGKLLEQTEMTHHIGHGSDLVRQARPHVHSTLCIGNLVYTADLGLDRIIVYRLNRKDGTLWIKDRIMFEPGAGPRHMVSVPGHPKLIYVVGELSGNVYKLDINSETMLGWRIIPRDEQRKLRPSSIKVAGSQIYIGCREINAIATFDIGEYGNLEDRRVYSHWKETPRDVWMDEHWCITADQGSGGLTLYQRDGDGMDLIGFTETPGVRPSCIVPVQ